VAAAFPDVAFDLGEVLPKHVGSWPDVKKGWLTPAVSKSATCLPVIDVRRFLDGAFYSVKTSGIMSKAVLPAVIYRNHADTMTT
jgi:hypothetical protein